MNNTERFCIILFNPYFPLQAKFDCNQTVCTLINFSSSHNFLKIVLNLIYNACMKGDQDLVDIVFLLHIEDKFQM